MKRAKILEYLNDLGESYLNSPLIPQVVGDELTFTLKKNIREFLLRISQVQASRC